MVRSCLTLGSGPDEKVASDFTSVPDPSARRLFPLCGRDFRNCHENRHPYPGACPNDYTQVPVPMTTARKSPPLPNSAQKFVSRSLLHLDVGEKFLASILQAGTKDVDHIINNQEAIMIPLADIDCDGRVLLVMALHV